MRHKASYLSRLSFKVLLATLVILNASQTQAQSPSTSLSSNRLGVILFSPTGFSYEHALSGEHSLDAAIGWSFGDSVRLHADYLWKKPNTITIDNEKLGYYFGIGGRFVDHDSDYHPRSDSSHQSHVGIRGPLGIEYFFRQAPLQVFLEGALVMEFAPDTNLDLDLGLGLRYCF